MRVVNGRTSALTTARWTMKLPTALLEGTHRLAFTARYAISTSVQRSASTYRCGDAAVGLQVTCRPTERHSAPLGTRTWRRVTPRRLAAGADPSEAAQELADEDWLESESPLGLDAASVWLPPRPATLRKVKSAAVTLTAPPCATRPPLSAQRRHRSEIRSRPPATPYAAPVRRSTPPAAAAHGRPLAAWATGRWSRSRSE
jgi:hypothetical protein